MNKTARMIVVAALVVIVGAVLVAKRAPSPGASESKPEAATPAMAAQPKTDAPSFTVPPTTSPVAAAMPRLVDLGANACIPCKKMAPILEDLKTTMAGKLQVDFIDVWKNPDAGQKYGIRLIPTQIFYDASGKELSRHEGFMPREEILARFKEHGIELPAN